MKSNETARCEANGDLASQVTLIEGIQASEHVLDLFLANKFNEAKETSRVLAANSMYHAVSYGTMLHLQAAATLEQNDLIMATDNIKHAVRVCIQSRRKALFSDNFSKSTVKMKAKFFAAFTDEQAHAELCYAESLLQLVFLTVLQDEKLVTLIKSSLKLRECYKCYRTCWKIYKNKDWGTSHTRAAFESGVQMGVGAFNLLLSMLPTKVLSLLEIVGFSGKKEVGLQLLRQGTKVRHGVRDPLCTLIILVYDLYATQMIGDTSCNYSGEEAAALVEARLLLNEWKVRAPNSAFFLFLQGRLEILSGNFSVSKELFFKSIECQSEFVNYHHICCWELMWCHCVQGEWLLAMKYAEKLACESKWSQATYRYLKAAFIIQFMDDDMRVSGNLVQQMLSSIDIKTNRRASLEANTPQSTKAYTVKKGKPDSNPIPIDRDCSQDADGGTMSRHVEKLLEGVPQMIQRIAGKSLPIEKFALVKSKRYFEQGKRLTLPGIELMYLWNGFKLISNNKEIINHFIIIIESKLNEIVDNEALLRYPKDDFCLVTLLKGVCLRCLQKNFQAKNCFNEILQHAKQIQLDRYLLPFSQVELCQIYLEEGSYSDAKKHLDAAWSYTKYSLEARLHFRLHSLTAQLKEMKHGVDNSVTSKNMDNLSIYEASPIVSWHADLNKAGADNDVVVDNPFDLAYDPNIDDFVQPLDIDFN